MTLAVYFLIGVFALGLLLGHLSGNKAAKMIDLALLAILALAIMMRLAGLL